MAVVEFAENNLLKICNDFINSGHWPIVGGFVLHEKMVQLRTYDTIENGTAVAGVTGDEFGCDTVEKSVLFR